MQLHFIQLSFLIYIHTCHEMNFLSTLFPFLEKRQKQNVDSPSKVVLGAHLKFSLGSADKWPKKIAPIPKIFNLLLNLVCQPSALGPSIPEVSTDAAVHFASISLHLVIDKESNRRSSNPGQTKTGVSLVQEKLLKKEA